MQVPQKPKHESGDNLKQNSRVGSKWRWVCIGFLPAMLGLSVIMLRGKNPNHTYDNILLWFLIILNLTVSFVVGYGMWKTHENANARLVNQLVTVPALLVCNVVIFFGIGCCIYPIKI
jgi:cytochrome bd-type quinol oxidase subunit 2